MHRRLVNSHLLLSEFPGGSADNQQQRLVDQNVQQSINSSSAPFPLLVHIFYTTFFVTKNGITHPIADVKRNISTEIPTVCIAKFIFI
jgi:hypothetical protein